MHGFDWPSQAPKAPLATEGKRSNDNNDTLTPNNTLKNDYTKNKKEDTNIYNLSKTHLRLKPLKTSIIQSRLRFGCGACRQNDIYDQTCLQLRALMRQPVLEQIRCFVYVCNPHCSHTLPNLFTIIYKLLTTRLPHIQKLPKGWLQC